MEYIRRFSCQKFNKLRKRHILLLVMSSVIFSFNTVRFAVLELAETHMQQPNSSQTSDHCNLTKRGVKPFLARRDLPWDSSVAATIFNSYGRSYLAFQLLAGILTDKRNVGRYLILGIISAHTIMTILFPAIVQNVKGYWQVVAAWSGLFGLIHGAAFPILLAILGQWIPRGEKTIALSVTHSATPLAYATNRLLGTYFCTSLERWATTVYLFGSFAALTSLMWFCFCYASPETHPTITPKEKIFLRRKIGPYYDHKIKTIPWWKMFKSLPFWALCINAMGSSITWYTITVEYPMYMTTALKVDFKRVALDIYARPNALTITTSVVGALVCDFLIRRDLVHITTVRKVYNHIGSIGTTCFALSATYAYCNQSLSLSLYSVILPFMIVYYIGATVNILDIAPNFAGTILGLINMMTLLIKFVRPLITQKWIKDNNLSGWKYTFWFSLATCAVTDIVFALFCKGTEQRWNLPQQLRDKNRAH